MSGGDPGRFRARFARTPEDVEAAQRLRYEVFNRELGEGLAESEAEELDRDRFDAQCEHLLVEDSQTVMFLCFSPEFIYIVAVKGSATENSLKTTYQTIIFLVIFNCEFHGIPPNSGNSVPRA